MKNKSSQTINQSNPEKLLTADEALGDTEANKIWKEIKDSPIAMFGLPNQVVSQYCVPTPVDPTRLFLMLTASAVLPSLEFAISPKYTVELTGKYVVVVPAIDPLLRK